MKKYFSLTLFIMFSVSGVCQEKELLIIGTMHDVPKIVKNSYRPLLKYAKRYNPEAIYVEYIRPDDTISQNFHTKKFVELSDSARYAFAEDSARFKKLKKLQLTELGKDDFNFLANTYLVNRDFANYLYYSYLERYGLKGTREPLRNESSDLSFKLAIAMGIKEFYSMDDQQASGKYYKAWRECSEIGSKNGDNEIGDRLCKKDFNRAIIPSVFGCLGKYTNSPKSLGRKHTINSFGYVKNPNEHSNAAKKYWDERNYRMAKNIAEQVKANPYRRNIVIVGAGHVVGLRRVFEENYPELKVKLMYN